MVYLTITFKNNTQATYIAEEVRITRGFIKVINSTYGNRAFPKTEVNSMYIIMVEGDE